MAGSEIVIKVDDTEMSKYREAFRLFDVNDTGDITVTELKEIFDSLGFDSKAEAIQERLAEVDLRHNGVINFDEFMKVVSCEIIQEEDDEMRKLFHIFDPEQVGYVSKEQLNSVLMKLGLNFTEKQVEMMIHFADGDGDGRINYEEFITMNKKGLHSSNQPVRKRTFSSCLSEVQMNNYREAFRLFDIDQTNKISIDELKKVLHNLGFSVGDDAELQRRIKEVDRRRNGVINFDEFIEVVASAKHDTKDNEMLRIFKMFDLEGNGYISQDELAEVLRRLGFVFTRKQIQAMIRYADVEGDGRINFEEFLKVNDVRLHQD